MALITHPGQISCPYIPDIFRMLPDNRIKHLDQAAENAGEYFLSEIYDITAPYYKTKMRTWFKKEYGAYIQFVPPRVTSGYFDHSYPVIMRIDPEKEVLLKMQFG